MDERKLMEQLKTSADSVKIPERLKPEQIKKKLESQSARQARKRKPPDGRRMSCIWNLLPERKPLWIRRGQCLQMEMKENLQKSDLMQEKYQRNLRNSKTEERRQ